MRVRLSIRQASRELRRDRAFLAQRLRALAIKPAGDRGGNPVYVLRDLLRAAGRTLFGEPDTNVMTPYEKHAHFKAELERLRVDRECTALLQREEVDAEWARIVRVINHELDLAAVELEQALGQQPRILEKLDLKFDTIRELLRR